MVRFIRIEMVLKLPSFFNTHPLFVAVFILRDPELLSPRFRWSGDVSSMLVKIRHYCTALGPLLQLDGVCSCGLSIPTPTPFYDGRASGPW